MHRKYRPQRSDSTPTDPPHRSHTDIASPTRQILRLVRTGLLTHHRMNPSSTVPEPTVISVISVTSVAESSDANGIQSDGAAVAASQVQRNYTNPPALSKIRVRTFEHAPYPRLPDPHGWP
jgi:hypothetical protein